MAEMLRFLNSAGLNDITFIVVNSRQQSSQLSIKVLSDIIGNTKILLYQETDESPVWEKLEGANKDVFVYDRCGRLTYYLPYPLSMIDPRQPILQTALLSTYFDNPCGNACEMNFRKPLVNGVSTASSTFEQSFNVTAEVSSNVTQSNEIANNTVTTANIRSELKEDELLTVSQYENSTFIGDIGSGSGDGEITVNETMTTGISEPAVNVTDELTLDNSTTVNLESEWNVSVSSVAPAGEESSPFESWRIFRFFMDHKKVEVTSTEYTYTQVNDTENATVTSPVVEVDTTTPVPKKNHCTNVDKSVCVEFSTDRLLRARLCCLKEDIGKDGESRNFGCRRFTKTMCSKMLPLLKCCLKDFSQLLENYFKTKESAKITKAAYVG